MGRKAKYTKEIKIKVVNEYIKGIKSIGDIAYELGIYTFDDGYAYYFDDTSTMLSCCTPDGSQYKSY